MNVQLRPNVRVRAWEWRDATSLVRHANNLNVARNLAPCFPHPYTDFDAQDWLGRVVGVEPVLNWAIEVDGEAAGSTGLRTDVDRPGVAEIGYWVSEAHWGRGIVPEAVVAVTAHAFAHLDLTRIEAYVFAANDRSMQVLRRTGFTMDERWHIRPSREGPPVEVRVFYLERPN